MDVENPIQVEQKEGESPIKKEEFAMTLDKFTELKPVLENLYKIITEMAEEVKEINPKLAEETLSSAEEIRSVINYYNLKCKEIIDETEKMLSGK